MPDDEQSETDDTYLHFICFLTDNNGETVASQLDNIFGLQLFLLFFQQLFSIKLFTDKNILSKLIFFAQVREFNDEGLTYKATCDGVTSTQKFKRD